MAPQPKPAQSQAPAPPANPGLGGLSLSSLASQGQAETDRRIAGQSHLIDAYLDQALGMNDARNAADSERQQRMLAFRRQQALLQEEMQRSRMSQNEALQRARIEAAASEGQKDRDFRSALAAEERAFELGQAAVQSEREDLENRMLELQVQQMEQELGGTLDGDDFGQYDVSWTRGDALTPGRRDDLRDVTFRNTDEGTFGFLPGRQGDYGSAITYDDLAQDALGIVNQYGQDPNEVTRRVRELARGRPQLASTLLYDLGYNPAAFLGPQGG